MKVYRYLTGKDDVNFCARVTKALNNDRLSYCYNTLNLTFILIQNSCKGAYTVLNDAIFKII